MQTLSTFTLQSDVLVTEDGVNQLVHGRFLEFASLSCLTAKGSGSFDLLLEEVANIDTPIFSADEPTGDTSTLDLLALVNRGIEVIPGLDGRVTFVESAVERFDLSSPKLESAGPVGFGATESNLGWSTWKHVEDLPVGDIAHLVVVENGLSASIACHVLNRFFIVTVCLEFAE